MGIRRVPALSNTFSGVAAEARVSAELVRHGFRVAKPLWTDDEVDLIVLCKGEGTALPIPIQVKSVQFLESKTKKLSDPRFVCNLKKKYIEKNSALCLAIYRPDIDRIWFIDGPENIKRVYDQDAKASSRKLYLELEETSEVRIRLTFDDCPLDKDWLAPRDDGKWWSDRFAHFVSKLVAKNLQTVQLHRFFDEFLDEDDEISEEGGQTPVK